MTWISRDPKIRSGRPTIRGTRVGVEIISHYLNDPEPDRLTDQEIHEEYPHVPLEAITWLRNHPEEWIHQ